MISISDLLLFVTFALFGIYIWAKYHFSYWRRKNVASVEPNYLFGNLKDLIMLKKNWALVLEDLYNHKNAQDQPILGIHIFNTPALLIRDPELIKSILVKNFNKFSDRYAKSDPEFDALGSGTLFLIKNPQWKELRTKLTPVFSSGKIKQMFPLVQNVGNELDKFLCSLKNDTNTGTFIQEVKEMSALYTTDVIATVAFGIETNSLKNPKGAFRKIGRSVLNFNLLRAFQFLIGFFLPHLAKLSRLKLFPNDSEIFFRATINNIMEKRIQSGKARNDLIDVLVEFKKAADYENKNINDCLAVNSDLLVAQAASFFIGGFETSAASMSFGLYELSKNPEIQKRLREEIRQVLIKNATDALTYEDVKEMQYLDMVVMETLRLYPTLPFLDRVCTLPKDEKEFSLKPVCDFAIPNNMPVYIPKIAIHRDPKYFTNPEIFDPERFSAKNKSNIKPGTYFPFGLGPRNCIGYRFGLIQTKIGLISILRNHFVSISDKTLKKMELDPKAMFIQAKGGIFCSFLSDPLV